MNETTRVVLAASPHASVRVSVTVYGPFAGNVCDGADAVLVAVPSPKFHRYVNASPFGSAEPALDMLHTRPTHDGAPITGTGGRLVAGLAIVTTRVVLAESPHASVTVSVTV